MLSLLHVPLQFLNVLSRRCSISVHEIDRDFVAADDGKRRRLRPFDIDAGFTRAPNYPTRQRDISFRLWNLFHSAKKAELLEPRVGSEQFWSTAGFILENADLFAPTRDLRLNPGKAKLYGDFSASSLSGRLGQGMTFLFMNQQGYPFGERFEALLAGSQGAAFSRPLNRSRTVVGSQFSMRQQKAPDFIFELGKAPNECALVEAKGSFVAPGSNDPDIKGTLRRGLQQLEGWGHQLDPIPSKSFVVGSFIREAGDVRKEPSILCFVDPKPVGSSKQPWRYPSDSIRRANYAAWLRGMGFIDSAADLLARRSRVGMKEYRFARVKRGERSFAFFVPRYAEPVLHYATGGQILLGLEERVLRAISKALEDPESNSLLSEDILLKDVDDRDDVDGSCFLDGTFIGYLRWDELYRSEVGIVL